MNIEINDAIHKTIALSEREKEIVDHPYVQRLRFIRQLGLISLVYPSATHDRFSHALGTMHVTGILARQILYDEQHSILANLLNEKEKELVFRMVRLAGLLHDVGHAPFSHAADEVMPEVQKLNIPREWLENPDEKRMATHEDYGVLMIDGMTEGPAAVLDKEEAAILSSIIHHKKIKIPASWGKHYSSKVDSVALHKFVRSLVSGDIDGDRMDYLLRDSHFTGVVYGNFDLEWLVSNLGSVENNGQYMLSVSDTGIHALEYYLFARYHMHIQVYMHKTVKGFEYYFQRALDEGETTYNIPAGLDEYVSLRDSTILENLFMAASSNPRSWSARLVQRKPAKRVARIWGDEKTAEKVFQNMERVLKKHRVRSFLYTTRRKFLNMPSVGKQSSSGKQGMFLFDLATLPIVVIRKQFETVSMAPIAEYSFILKHYHRDICVSDIYILPEDYKKNETIIKKIVKKFRAFTPSEIEIQEN